MIRVGAVTYLNAQPLTFCLERLAPDVELTIDLPSRLADGLATGRFDVAMIPSIEYFRNPGYIIVSDACISCDGPVKSVKLYGRVPIEQVHTLALDEGSRSSAAATRSMLKERFALEPEVKILPIGSSPGDLHADATMLVGDRGMLTPDEKYEFVWDVGEEWSRWTGLPLVFAMWIARPGLDLGDLDERLSAARDEGLKRLAEIARLESPKLGIPESESLAYLRDNLTFRLGRRQREGLRLFYRLAARHRLVPTGGELVFHDCSTP